MRTSGLYRRTTEIAALAAMLIIASCGESKSRDARADRDRIAEDVMGRMDRLDEAAADATRVVILRNLGDDPAAVRGVLLEGRWLSKAEAESLAERLPLQIAGGLTPSEANRLATSLSERGAAVKIADNPPSDDSSSEGDRGSPMDSKVDGRL